MGIDLRIKLIKRNAETPSTRWVPAKGSFTSRHVRVPRGPSRRAPHAPHATRRASCPRRRLRHRSHAYPFRAPVAVGCAACADRFARFARFASPRLLQPRADASLDPPRYASSSGSRSASTCRMCVLGHARASTPSACCQRPVSTRRHVASAPSARGQRAVSMRLACGANAVGAVGAWARGHVTPTPAWCALGPTTRTPPVPTLQLRARHLRVPTAVATPEQRDRVTPEQARHPFGPTADYR